MIISKVSKQRISLARLHKCLPSSFLDNRITEDRQQLSKGEEASPAWSKEEIHSSELGRSQTLQLFLGGALRSPMSIILSHLTRLWLSRLKTSLKRIYAS